MWYSSIVNIQLHQMSLEINHSSTWLHFACEKPYKSSERTSTVCFPPDVSTVTGSVGPKIHVFKSDIQRTCKYRFRSRRKMFKRGSYKNGTCFFLKKNVENLINLQTRGPGAISLMSTENHLNGKQLMIFRWPNEIFLIAINDIQHTSGLFVQRTILVCLIKRDPITEGLMNNK